MTSMTTYMPLHPRPAGQPLAALTSGFKISMRHAHRRQTSAAVDTTVSIAAGAFVAASALGLVLIYGPAAAPAVAATVPLAVVANRSYLRRRTVHRR
ncbi:hypothetical protein [Streptomyces chattanoogensis]|uniref:hypothetical protein n=1 Tax=Streptomyces chattanoogensis TaxID=66876 RepID=UPI0005D7D411|nr:hypothetical protein T261_0410 [Streptomyces lydicus]